MEKIKLKNGQLFDLVSMGITSSDKRRSFTFTSTLAFTDIELSFTDSNVSNIQYLSATDEILASYTDCVTLKSLLRDIEGGTYTAVISVDAFDRKILDLQKYTDGAICELTFLFSMMMGGF